MTLARWLVHDHRRGIVGWAAGMVGMVAFVAVFFPSMRDNPEMAAAIDDLPDSLKALAGLVGDVSFTSPPGYLHSQLLTTMLPLLLVVLGIGLGARESAGIEEDGLLEAALTMPVSRRRSWCERSAAIAGLVILQATVRARRRRRRRRPMVGLLDGVAIGHLALACLAAALLALVHMAVAYAVGCATGRRGLAIAVATVVAAVGYLVEGLSSLSPPAETAALVSPWHWYLDRVIVVDGVSWATLVVPAAVALALVAAGVGCSRGATCAESGQDRGAHTVAAADGALHRPGTRVRVLTGQPHPAVAPLQCLHRGPRPAGAEHGAGAQRPAVVGPVGDEGRAHETAGSRDDPLGLGHDPAIDVGEREERSTVVARRPRRQHTHRRRARHRSRRTISPQARSLSTRPLRP